MARMLFHSAILLTLFGTGVLAQNAEKTVSITTTSLPPGTIGQNYEQALAATGGKQPYTWALGGGSLPSGLQLSKAGDISGKPSTGGASAFTVQVTDDTKQSDTQALSITVDAALAVVTSTIPHATTGSLYTTLLAASGGSPPYQWSVSSGSLPPGLTLSAIGVILGNPSAPGTSNFTVQVKDAANATATEPLTLIVDPGPLTVTTLSLPNGTVGSNYSQTLSSTGGSGGNNWSVATGSLPTGLSLSSTGTISGIPTTAGISGFTAQVRDSAGDTATQALTITIPAAPLTVATASLPNGTVGVAYSQTLAATGGTGGNTWSMTAGSLPQGLNLSQGGVILGTPSVPGASAFTVEVDDNSGNKATKPLSITVKGPPITITTSSLPNGTVGASYSQALAASGGTGGFTWSVTAGNLPQGLSLSQAGAISGTPSTAGNSTFTVQVQDSSGTTATKPLGITINAPPLIITTASLPNGTVGAGYSQALAASGGTGGFTWSVTAGNLPQGLNLSQAGAISGTPSTAGNSTFTVQVQDSSGTTATKPLGIIINVPPLTITTASLPNGTVGASYSQALAASGGTGGFTWSVTAGNLPQGLALSPSGTISGTPSAAGSSTFTVQVQDSSGTTAGKQLSIAVGAPALTIATASLPNGTVGASYSQALAASGGTGGFTWSVTAGNLPQGLSLSQAGTISGTPSTAGSSTFTVQVQDSSGTTAGKQLSIAISPPALTITTVSLPNGTVGASYSTALAASGGTGGYIWSVASGALPSGISLSANGTLSGTPTAPGSVTFTLQVTDSSAATATHQFGIAIASLVTITSPATLPPGAVGVPYSVSLSAAGGVSPYTWSLASGQLPPGLTLSAAGSISGTPTAAGGFTFAVSAADSSGARATGQAGISIQGSVSISTPPTLASGALGSPYTQAMTATGGASPYTWALVSGTLPTGLSLGSSTGIISGTPTQTGSFQIGVRVNDASSATATATFSLSIVNGLVIATAPVLPTATVGVPYNLSLSGAGGTAPYQWSITTGALPGGLNFSAGGQLSGTPTAGGNFSFTARAVDSASHTVSKDFTLAVAPALTITSAPALPPAVTGATYRQAISATGGTPPYVWSVSAGALPGGLTLDASTGILSGSPTATGAFNFTVTVTDSNSAASHQAFNLSVSQGVTVNAPASLPGATAGSAYSFTFSATGGKQPYSWIVTQGALPAGLSLDPASGAITGTPTAGGAFTFTVQVTDSGGLTSTRAETLAVALPSPPALQITGLPAGIASAQQPLIDLALAQPFPVDITGVLNLSFAPANNGPDDPAVQFSTGGRSATFTIPGGATHATFGAPQFALQTGSVAGTITVAIGSLQASGSPLTLPGDVTASTQVPASAPSVRSVSMTPTGGGFQVTIVGMSNTREVTQATVTFQPAAGGSLQTGSLVVPLGDAAKAWFQGSGSAPYGGQFSLTIPFSVNGGSNVVGAVSVVLSNSVGNSASAGSQ